MTQTAKTTTNQPTHALFLVTGGKDEKAHWTCIGAAWPHKDGKGFNLSLDLLPRDGRITLRVIDNSNNSNAQ